MGEKGTKGGNSLGKMIKTVSFRMSYKLIEETSNLFFCNML